MSAANLQWRRLISENDPKFMVKGTELEQALCGQHSRFAIVSVRFYDVDGFSDMYYRVRDAQTVSDAEIKEGVRPKVVFNAKYLDEAINFCMKG